jgi:mono/diheme cytochrome c family protein
MLLSLTCTQAAQTPDWSRDAKIPVGQDRANIFKLNLNEQILQTQRGKSHALIYPVSTTKLLLPYGPMKDFLNADQNNPLKKFVTLLTKKRIDVNSEEGFFAWLGLPQYPQTQELNVFSPFYIPRPQENTLAMGAALIQGEAGKGMTFSCAACHSHNLFGRPVLGLPNKRPRSNELFLLGEKYTPHIPTKLFALSTGASAEEVEIFKNLKQFVPATGGKSPQSLGLDTSLAQVGISLAHRSPDAWATYSSKFQKKPRPNMLDQHVADSRPLPWWNVKYKTRWLSDGSVISGNPILTNILWNEIGRGADLKELSQWMINNKQKIDELTAAVFASRAPLWTDYFDENTIDERLARQGETIFNNTCQKCHGGYEKTWSLPLSHLLPKKQRLQTIRVHYFEQTPVKNVGTDPGRFQGIVGIATALNQLAISKEMQTDIVPQDGYAPPPLVGIWSRYPYFHNNSIPNLCALLTVAKDRPVRFYQGPSDNIDTDFDKNCIGYPLGQETPASWVQTEALVDTKRPGLSNIGHEKMLLKEDGTERFGPEDKKALMEFLKTL